MEFDAKKIFQDLTRFSNVHTKTDYETQMKVFNEERYSLIKPLAEAEDIEAASKQFCESVSEGFKKFGKVRGGDLMSLNYFMIYYIFPAIQQNEEPDKAIRICDTLKNVWNSHFKCNISYSDYDTLMEGFKTKIFGITIGK